MCFPWTICARNRQAKRYDELMHLHEKPKGRAVKILAAGQPCKIREGNESNLEKLAAMHFLLFAPKHHTSPSSLRTQGLSL
jgi:hypothetical protein